MCSKTVLISTRILFFIILIIISTGCSYTGKGLSAWNDGNYTDSLFYFGKGLDNGSTNSAIFLGFMYAYGMGVPENLDNASVYARKAVELNDSGHSFYDQEIKLLMASIVLKDPEAKGDKEAIKVLRNPYYSTDPFAIELLAFCYLWGIGVDIDESKALALYEHGMNEGYQFIAQRYAKVLVTHPSKHVRNGNKAKEIIDNIIENENTLHFTTLATQAAVYAELGDFKKAVMIQTKAISRAKIEVGIRPELEPWLEHYDERIRLYKKNMPFRKNYWQEAEKKLNSA